MINLEKYKDDLLLVGTNFMVSKQGNVYGCPIDGCEDCIFWKYPNVYEDSDIVECEYRKMKWLMDEYKEPILDEVEREYLKGVIEPFRDDIKYIGKWSIGGGYERIFIELKNCDMSFPIFKAGTMYKGMEAGKKYTLKELGL